MNAPHQEWIGRGTVAEDCLTRGAVEGLLAVLDRKSSISEGDAAPQGSHWLLAPPRYPMSGLGADGHPARGDLMPPIDAKRRMWAASDVHFFMPLAVGSPCKRTSRIVDISRKEGRQGALWLVELEHLVEVEGRRVLSERQTLAYTDAPPARERAPESGFDSSCWPNVRMVDTDPVLLFRYSALTFNAHRIHYDLPYATQEEGYPGLVVQGPLIATLLLNFCSELLQGPVERFAFRSVSPALCGAALQLLAREADGRLEMMAVDEDGRQLTKATAHGQPPAGGRAIQNEGQLQW